MGPQYTWGEHMWFFPMMMPVFMLTIVLVILYLIFGRGICRSRWGDQKSDQKGDESALDILKKRYASGEITKEEFDSIRKDIE